MEEEKAEDVGMDETKKEEGPKIQAELEERKEKLVNFLKFKPYWLYYALLALLMWVGIYIRTRNLKHLVDITTGKFIPLALDPFVVLRYVRYLLENGKLMAFDSMRYIPVGFANPTNEFGFLANFIVWLYKFFHFFNSSITIEQVHVLYPVVAFGLSLIFFFLLVKNLFNWKVSLIATAFLIVIPTYLYRTMAGFSDKESLAMLLMFMVFYFYVGAWKSKKMGVCLILGALSGIFTGFMGLVWGGFSFVFLTIGSFAFVGIFLDKFSKKDFYVYTAWIFFTVLVLLVFPSKHDLISLLTSFTSGLAILAFAAAIINQLFNSRTEFKEKIIERIPVGFASILLAFLLAFFVLLVIGPGIIPEKISDLFIQFTRPFGTSRWGLTVAEAHQPFFKDWLGHFGTFFVFLFMVGSTLLFYELVKTVRGPKSLFAYVSTALYAAFILAFTMSRYSNGSIFDGTTMLSHLLYLGSLVAFFAIVGFFTLRVFYKDKQIYKKIKEIDRTYFFVFMWFLVMVIAARSAIRLLFIFSPIVCVLAAFFLVRVGEYGYKIKENLYKFSIIVAVSLIAIFVFYGFAKTSLSQSSYTGPSYNQQWQYAGEWIRGNTPEDSVFAHWWDYGYWVQTGGERATITDGGNTGGPSLNYFMGRNVLTGNSEDEALEFLLTRKADYLLMISDEIGKYPAFSSIGADADYDRYSWITTFVIDNQQTQETRDETIFLYKGGTVLDDDFMYEGNLFPAGRAGIGGFLVPMKQAGESVEIEQPTAILFYNNQRFDIPLECVFFEGKEMVFAEKGLDGCLRIMPVIRGNQVEPFGAALYLSPEVRKTLFARLYLYGLGSSSFKLVYSDEDKMPLSLYQGRVIGPIKIWEISYPSYLKENSIYLDPAFPDPRANEIKENFM